MKRRPIFCLLAGAMALTLAACWDGPKEGTGPAPTPVAWETPAPSPEPVRGAAVYAADVPPGDYAPWQEAYMELLTRLCREEAATVEWLRQPGKPGDDPERRERADGVSERYHLYDMDGDGVPELFIGFGADAVRRVECYTFQNGEPRFLGSVGPFDQTTAFLYACPGEEAFLLAAHNWETNYRSIEKYTLENGRLSCEGEIFGEYASIDPETRCTVYTPVEEAVPGAFALDSYRTRLGWQDGTPLLLPICDHEALPRKRSAPMEEDAVRCAIGRALWEGGAFAAAYGSSYSGSAEEITLEKYLSLGAVYSPARPLTAKEYAWADVNGDGQTDCILWVEEEPDLYGDHASFHVIFSVEDGTVYAYLYHPFDKEVTEDGAFKLLNDLHKISFWKNQCYTYKAPQPQQAAFLKWEPFVPEKGEG